MKDRSRDILRALMDPGEGGDPVPWAPSDLRAILSHQLALPLEAEISHLARLAGCSTDEASVAIERSGCRTFADVLREPAKARWLLGLLKRFAKGSLATAGDLPLEVARVLYVAAIVRGRQAGIDDMTTLDDGTIEREVARCLTYGWLPDEVGRALRDGLTGRR